MADNYQRQIAYKVRIRDILSGRYVKQEGWEPNYVLAEDGRKLSRVNIIATVISADGNSAAVDDGSGSINLRAFEAEGPLSRISIGSIVLIIGRPREYSNELYLLPEIIKDIQDKKWVKVRQLELEDKPKAPVQPEVIERPVSAQQSQIEKVYALVKELDQGDGADSEQVIAKSGIERAERVISNLLMEGEIFESSPGKLKVLD